MKKLLTLGIFMIIGLMSFAQNSREVYCEIIGKGTWSFTGKIKVEVDFGQDNRVFEGINNDVLKDPATGKIRRFNSMIDALNFMAADGWIFVNAYNVSNRNGTSGGMSNEYHYIMRKSIAME